MDNPPLFAIPESILAAILYCGAHRTLDKILNLRLVCKRFAMIVETHLLCLPHPIRCVVRTTLTTVRIVTPCNYKQLSARFPHLKFEAFVCSKDDDSKSECPKTDYSELSDLHSLHICNLHSKTPLQQFSTIHCLCIDGWQGSDVSALAHNYELKFFHCNNMKDVSPLCGVRVLKIHGCDAVTDASALAHVYNLSIVNCRRITDYSALGTVHTLELSGNFQSVDASSLGSVHTLYLGNKSVKNLSALASVHKLTLVNCTGLAGDLSCLATVYELELSFCKEEIHVSSLHSVQILRLANSAAINGLHCLGSVPHLQIDSYREPLDLSRLCHGSSLVLRDCPNLHNLSFLSSIPKVEIYWKSPLDPLQAVSRLAASHLLPLSTAATLWTTSYSYEESLLTRNGNKKNSL